MYIPAFFLLVELKLVDCWGRYQVSYQGSKRSQLRSVFDLYFTHVHLFTIAAIACGIVYGVRVSLLQCDPY